MEDAADVVARALAVLPDGPAVEVRLAPGTAGDAAADAVRGRGARVVADPALGSGDAVVVTSDHVVDLRLDAALERLDAVLSGTTPGTSGPTGGAA